MNPYTKNINRIEFVVTMACTGRCKHCSEGEHINSGVALDGNAAAEVVRKVAARYDVKTLMTFGGEPLLRPDAVCKIHAAAREMGIPKRQIITNGFFTRDVAKIRDVAANLAESGVNDVLLSVDAFHQETIPLEPVKAFAEALQAVGVPLRTHPAWLVSVEDGNAYNVRTRELLAEFEAMGIAPSSGNVIFPSGNALTYLAEYFDLDNPPENPYDENPEDIRTVSVGEDGNVLGGNIYERDILEIIDGYWPVKG